MAGCNVGPCLLSLVWWMNESLKCVLFARLWSWFRELCKPLLSTGNHWVQAKVAVACPQRQTFTVLKAWQKTSQCKQTRTNMVSVVRTNICNGLDGKYHHIILLLLILLPYYISTTTPVITTAHVVIIMWSMRLKGKFGCGYNRQSPTETLSDLHVNLFKSTFLSP